MAQDLLGRWPRMQTQTTIWLRALLRPSLASFAALGQQPAIGVWRSYAWIFVGGLIGAASQTLPQIEAQLLAGRAIDVLLVALVPVVALICVSYFAAFAWCAQRVARLLGGTGSYQQLTCVFAAFSTPLLAVASILDLVSPTRIILVVVNVYWLVLYVLAVRAVHGLSKRAALVAVLAALLGLGLVWVAALLLALSSGLLLP